jgi:hypothetical protein
MATPAAPGDPLKDLASRIYIELIGQTVVVTENAAQVKCNPDNLAKISIKLAEAFLRADAENREASMPKNQGFAIAGSDLSGWNKQS